MIMKSYKFLKNVMKNKNVEAKKALDEAIQEKIQNKMRKILNKK